MNGLTMSFASKLHDLRSRRKLSLQDVADKIGISKAHVFNLEKGITANPSMDLSSNWPNFTVSGLPILLARIPMRKTSQPKWWPCSGT